MHIIKGYKCKVFIGKSDETKGFEKKLQLKITAEKKFTDLPYHTEKQV